MVNLLLNSGASLLNGKPITYLTQWKIVGNSEVHTLPYPDGIVLPNGYKRCEYLEFHGTEYIDTGIIPEQNVKIETKCSFSQLTNNALFGCRVSAWSNDSLYCYLSNNSYFLISYGGRIIDQSNNPILYNTANEIIELDLDDSTLNVQKGGNTYTVNVTHEIVKGTNNLFIGKINGLNMYYRGKLFLFIIKIGNNLLFNGIPCLDDNDVPCLYDTISGTSFYNDGTGTFGYEIEPQPAEIWSCGEYNATDGKYHILVQPLGGSIADIALDEPLRKVNDVADNIELVNGVATLTKNIGNKKFSDLTFVNQTSRTGKLRFQAAVSGKLEGLDIGLLCAKYTTESWKNVADILGTGNMIIGTTAKVIAVYDKAYTDAKTFKNDNANVEVFYPLATPTTELVDAPQIEEADSYSMVISQGAKTVEWSSFETE